MQMIKILRKKKLFLVLILIGVFAVGFLLGSIYKVDNSKVAATVGVSSSELLNKKIAEQEKEIEDLIKDRVVHEGVVVTSYSFKDFGLYSPLFENKEVINTTYSYKRKKIINRTIILEKDPQGNTKSGVSVWEYPPGAENIYVENYENYGNQPTKVDLTFSNLEEFKTAKGLEMYLSYKYCAKPICEVVLSSFVQYTPSGNPIYVQAWVNNPNYPKDDGGIAQAKASVKKIADTLEDLQIHH